MRSRVVFIALGGILVAACGISAVGELAVNGGDGGTNPTTDGAPAGDGRVPIDDDGGTGTNDAGPDAFDATPACDSGLGDAGVLVLPPDGGTCPMGTTEQVVQTSPAPVSGACACGDCTVTSEASCAGPNFQVTYATNNACGGGPLTYNPANNTCTNFNQGTFTVTDYHRWTARTPTAGTCTAPALTDATKVTSTPLRTCVASSTEIACQSPPGTRFCIESAVACAAPFSETIAIGDGATVSCGACGCTRTGTSCTVDYHGNSSCSDAVRYSITANGTCTQTNDATGVNHFKVYAAGLACNSTPGTASATLTNPKTLCCTP